MWEWFAGGDRPKALEKRGLTQRRIALCGAAFIFINYVSVLAHHDFIKAAKTAWLTAILQRNKMRQKYHVLRLKSSVTSN